MTHCMSDSVDLNLGRLQETVKDTEAWYAAALHGVTKAGPGNSTTCPQNPCSTDGHSGSAAANAPVPSAS